MIVKREKIVMEMLKTFVLKVEPFAGTAVHEVSYDLCQLANRLGMRCEASFNGVKLWAKPGDNYLQLVAAFHKELKRPNCEYKLAQVT